MIQRIICGMAGGAVGLTAGLGSVAAHVGSHAATGGAHVHDLLGVAIVLVAIVGLVICWQRLRQ